VQHERLTLEVWLSACGLVVEFDLSRGLLSLTLCDVGNEWRGRVWKVQFTSAFLRVEWSLVYEA